MIDIILGSICIALIVERFFYAREMNMQLKDCIKALLSKNIQEFSNALGEDEKAKTPFTKPDEVPLEQADDNTFDKYIKLTNAQADEEEEEEVHE